MSERAISASLGSRLKQPLKYAWRNFGIRRYFLGRRLRKNRTDWETFAQAMTSHAPKSALLIIPSDPYLLTASVGDQAMIAAITSYWRNISPQIELHFATADSVADAAAREMNAIPLRMMGRDLSIQKVAGILQKQQFKVAVLMGADGMDGSYDPSFSADQLMTLDLAARSGSDCYITGFSISKIFHNEVVEIFRKISPDIRVNLRDPISLQRFENNTGRKANQVADVAFLLKPEYTRRVQALLEYIGLEKNQNRKVLAVNFQPLLLELQERDRFPELLDAFSDILTQVSERVNVSFILLSHDMRGESSDLHALAPLYSRLKGTLGNRLMLIDEQLTAPEIKALVGSVDMVLSGRMHLMIASLGSGTPVLGIDYKDKMEGLLTLLGLDTRSLISAKAILENPQKCAVHIVDFIAGLNDERRNISCRIDEIIDLSLRNFDGLASC